MADDGLTNEGLAKVRDQIERQVLRAGTEAIKRATKTTERGVEAVVRGAVGGNLWKAIDSEAFPTRRNIAREPSGVVMVRGKEGSRSRGAIQFFTQQGRIQARSDKYLAVPLPAAGRRRSDNGMLTPGDWEKANSTKLRYVYRRGKPALLVADNVTVGPKSGRVRTRASSDKIGPGIYGRRAATVPIFVLVPFVPFANSADLGAPVGRAGREIEIEFNRAMRELAGR